MPDSPNLRDHSATHDEIPETDIMVLQYNTEFDQLAHQPEYGHPEFLKFTNLTLIHDETRTKSRSDH